MRRVENLLSSRSRDVGKFESDIAGVAVSQGETSVSLVLERTSWPTLTGKPPESEVIEAELWLSPDSGSNWRYLAGFGVGGGDYFNRYGDLAERAVLTIDLPDPSSTRRRLRVRANVRKKLVTACHLDIA